MAIHSPFAPLFHCLGRVWSSEHGDRCGNSPPPSLNRPAQLACCSFRLDRKHARAATVNKYPPYAMDGLPDGQGRKRRRAVRGQDPEGGTPGGMGGGAASSAPKRRRRFLWTDDLHRGFVAAIFDHGMKVRACAALAAAHPPPPAKPPPHHPGLHSQDSVRVDAADAREHDERPHQVTPAKVQGK